MLSMNCKTYLNTATGEGAWETPTWEEVDIIRDLTLPEEYDEIEVTARLSGGRKQFEPGLVDNPIEFDVLYKPGNELYDALAEAARTRAPIDLAIMDGDITVAGTQGLRGMFKIFKFTRDEKLADAVRVPVAIKLCHSDNPPEWLVTEAEEP